MNRHVVVVQPPVRREAALSKGWPKSPEVIAEELNACRFRAIDDG
jgi:hypothetical protein